MQACISSEASSLTSAVVMYLISVYIMFVCHLCSGVGLIFIPHKIDLNHLCSMDENRD